LGVQLEAGALEPLGEILAAVAAHLAAGLGEGQPEERQALGGAEAAPPVKVQAVALPVAQEGVADEVPRLGEILAAGLASAARLRLALPVAAELPQPLVAEAAEEHIVGSGVLGAQLEAVALELLHQHLGAA